MSRDLLKAKALEVGSVCDKFIENIRAANMPVWAFLEVQRLHGLAEELAVAAKIALEKGALDDGS